MLIMASLAISLSNTIWSLIVLKLEIMLQLSPSVILGVMYPSLRWQAILSGVVVGVITLMVLKFMPLVILMDIGVHAGMWALLLNLLTILLIHLISRNAAKAS